VNVGGFQPDSAAYFFRFFASEWDESEPPDFPDLSCRIPINLLLFNTSILLLDPKQSKSASIIWERPPLLPPFLPAPPLVNPIINAKAPGTPTSADGFTPKKNWDGKIVPSNGDYGYPDDQGRVWFPTGTGGTAHGGPHWDVQEKDGSHKNVYPGGIIR
jgi:hypothetical protein